MTRYFANVSHPYGAWLSHSCLVCDTYPPFLYINIYIIYIGYRDSRQQGRVGVCDLQLKMFSEKRGTRGTDEYKTAVLSGEKV